MKKNDATQIRPLLICSGQFFILTASAVTVHVITKDQTSQLYDRLRIAADCRDPEQASRDSFRLIFGLKDITHALPAPTVEALSFYAEHYDGPHTDTVRGLAACILTGTPFGPDEGPSDGGARDRMPVSPVRPSGPTSAVMRELQSVA